jgi:natural product biosynthesis luciferase-like monooxygenase protein
MDASTASHTSMPPPSALLIGADSLLIECGERWLARGFPLSGVISQAPRVRAWAEQRGLPWVALEGDWIRSAAGLAADYLLAITHLELLPPEALALGRRATINFHDGPLPDLRGLYCPVWALIEGRERYGISWHLVDAGIDTGALVEQTEFELHPGDTSLTLNTRCFEAALEGFEALLDQLASGTLRSSPQAGAPGRLFRGKDRPRGAGLLDWSQPAERLERLVRALDFGPYPNTFALPKLLYRAPDGGQRALRVGAARIAAASGAAGEPGRILASEGGRLTVLCAEGALELSGLTCLAGHPVDLLTLGLLPGGSLPALGAPDLERLDALARVQAQQPEARWVRWLSELEGLSLPLAAGRPAGQRARAASPVELPLPRALGELAPELRVQAVLAGFLAWLQRTAPEERFLVGFADPGMAALRQGLEALFAEGALLAVERDLARSSAACVQQLGAELARIQRCGPLPRDLALRDPGLAQRREALAGRLPPVLLRVGAAPAELAPERELELQLAEDGSTAALCFDGSRYDRAAIERLAAQLAWFLAQAVRAPEVPIAELELLPPEELALLLGPANDTARPLPAGLDLARAFELEAERRPDGPAVSFDGRTLTYAELDQRADQLARHLLSLGLAPEEPVGVHLLRSELLPLAVLGIWKAGGAYVPLDPDFPAERLAFMLADSGARLVLTESQIEAELPAPAGAAQRRVRLDLDAPAIGAQPALRPARPLDPARLAYILYTSGSTGRPKGVLVEHRNVLNFFSGMDERLPPARSAAPGRPTGTWLAVTSLSFDISVLELFYTLCRGYHVVVHRDRERGGQRSVARSKDPRPIDFSLFLWGNDAGEGPVKYRLLLEAAKFADAHGFEAVWTPERHFHAFGGPFPNPSVISAALATATCRIQIRAGSCVVPLHHPVRIAEEWAIVDNLSNGRVGLAAASGWQPDDFVLMPENYASNKQKMFENVELVRRLWRGEAVPFVNPFGEAVARQSLPRPIQRELPIWITSAGNPDTYIEAGRRGYNVLTHLLGQSVAEVAEKIAIYRRARAEAGFDPAAGRVTLMLHSFLGASLESVRETVRAPLKAYLDASVGLVKKYAWSFPAFKRPGSSGVATQDQDQLSELDLDSLSPEEQDAVLEHAFRRYFEHSGLFGTPESALEMVDRLKSIGVDEIGCLIDYGVDVDQMLASLPALAELMRRSRPAPESDAAGGGKPASIPQLIRRHGVTHLQSTPSLLRLLLLDPEAEGALAGLEQLCVGGEACPLDLARQLAGLLAAGGGRLTNLYGPTETTVWSSSAVLEPGLEAVTIGSPIANTQLYVLDERRRPLPLCVAGELWIGGAGVVRGYHRRPDLTDERFVADPLRRELAPGWPARLYRTGDQAAFGPDGRLIFLGRRDAQVKLRGYRIELGEIEQRLLACPGIGEAAVLVREDSPGDQRLVGYLTAKPGLAIDLEGAKAALRQSLPEYMVPALLVVLPAMPRTPNGKLDRRALPKPSLQSEAAAAPYEAPSEGLEATLAGHFRRVLGLPEIGRDQSFFDLGGHSLLVVKLHRDLSAALASELDQVPSLTDLYRFPTVRGLADFIQNGPDTDAVDRSSARGAARRSALQARRRRR